MRRQLLAPDLVATLNGHQPERLIQTSYSTVPVGDPLSGMLCADLATVLPDDFLVKVDRASMANGLEVRPPLLDHELMELAARIPSRWKVQGKDTKHIFKRAFQSRLPASIVRRAKQGFEIPIDSWLRGPLRETFEASVLQSGAELAPLIDQGVVRRLYRDHLAGVGRHGSVLWALLVLACWSGRFLGSTIVPPSCPAQKPRFISATERAG
jgi:asparagine synthase (glutamine-hydrolysing)